jgi:hypothetical protein
MPNKPQNMNRKQNSETTNNNFVEYLSNTSDATTKRSHQTRNHSLDNTRFILQTTRSYLHTAHNKRSSDSAFIMVFNLFAVAFSLVLILYEHVFQAFINALIQCRVTANVMVLYILETLTRYAIATDQYISEILTFENYNTSPPLWNGTVST